MVSAFLPVCTNTTLNNFALRRSAIFAAIIALVFVCALGSSANAQSTNFWRGEASNDNWANTDASNVNNWFRSGFGDVRRPDLADGQWSATATKAYNIIIFDNNHRTTTVLNGDVGGARFHVAELRLAASSDRTFNSSSGGFMAMSNASGVAKIESVSGGTGTYTFNVPILFEENTEINAVNGNLVFGSSSTITNNSFTLISYTTSGRTAAFNGVISGSGGLEHKGGGLVTLGAANTYTGATTVEGAGGRIQIENSSALGGTGTGTTVSSGAALQIFGSLGTISEGLTLNGTGISDGGALRNISGSSTWSGAITLASASRINADSGTTLTIDPTSGNAISGSFNLTLGGAGNININDPIATGSGTLTKDGGGILTLGAANTFSGATTINNGTVRVSADNNLGTAPGSATASMLVMSNTTTNLSAFVATETFTLDANRGINLVGSPSGGQSSYYIAVASGKTLTYNGVLAGAGNLVQNQAGTLSLGGNSSSYTGGIFVDEGTVAFAAGSLGTGTDLALGAANGANSATFVISGANLSTSRNIDVRSGNGARSITSANTSGLNTLSGNITLSNSLAFNVASGGTLLFGGGLTTLTGGSDVTRLALDGGGTLIVTNAGSGMPTTDRFQMRIGNGTLVIGAGTILARTNTSGLGHALDLGVDLNNAPVDAVSALRASNSVTISNSIYVSTTNSRARILGASGANATATFTGPIGLANSALWLDSTNGQTVSVSGAITNFSGTGSLIKTNDGLAILSGANTYVGTTLITNGNLRIANNSALGTSAAGTTVGSGAALELSNNIAVTGEALTLNGTGISSGGALRSVHGNNSSSGAITLASASRINSDTGTLTLSGGITGTGFGLTIGGAGNTLISGTGLNTSTSGTLTKDGAGVLTISAAGNYTGGTTLSEGTLRLDHVTAAGSGKITQSSGSSTLQVNTTGTVANTMDLYNVRTMQTVTLSGNKTLFNATYTVDPGTTTTESGNLTGAGGITKAGTGTLIVTGDNSYTGAVAVNEGVLNLNSGTGGAAASAASVSVAGGATLLISQSNQVNNSATVTLSGGTIQRGSGVSETFGALDLTGDSTLDFGAGAVGNLTFGTYESGTTPSNKLTVSNFAAGNTLKFGSNVGSFLPTGGALSNTYFSFNNAFTYNSSNFTITAIPEPSTYVAAAGLMAMFLWPVRRRVIKDIKSILGLRPTGRERIEAYRNA